MVVHAGSILTQKASRLPFADSETGCAPFSDPWYRAHRTTAATPPKQTRVAVWVFTHKCNPINDFCA
jgi:hypothetical protein